MNEVTLAFMLASNLFSLPHGLLSAICFVESKHKVAAINVNDGGSSSLGLCQIKLATARMLGYKGGAQRLHKDAVLNAEWAGRYLKRLLTRYDGNIPKAVAAYNAGRFISKGGKAVNQKYVDKVLLTWEGVK
jgi:soluble lytic murein transglycosylase